MSYRLLTLFFAVVIFLLPMSPAHASLSDAMDEMFMASATAPGVYESQRRGVIAGGAYSLRWPTRRINLIHIAPPNLSAGCSGIDFFGGSFSFISKDEFKQILRQIGSAAVGYAFQLAIATICQPCSSIMSWLEEMMNSINASKVSSCAIGAKIVSSIASPLKSDLNWAAQEELSSIEQAAGGSTDFLNTLRELFANPSFGRDAASYVQQSVAATGTTGGEEKIGNITFRALMKSNVAALLGGMSTGSATPDRHTVEALISLVGTVIYPQDAAATKEQGGCQASPADPEAACVITQYEPIFSLQNLMSSKGDRTTSTEKHQIWRCDTWGTGPLDCMSMSLGDYTGYTIDQIVHKHLFGHFDTSSIAPSPGSIVYRIQYGQPLTPTQQNLLTATPIPFLQLLQSVSQHPDSVAFVAHIIEKPLALEVASMIGTAVERAVHTAFSADKDKPGMPELVKRGLEKLGRSKKELAALRKSHLGTINNLARLAELVRTSIPDDTMIPKQKH